jgi:diacylglycerol kinase (ATP)
VSAPRISIVLNRAAGSVDDIDAITRLLTSRFTRAPLLFPEKSGDATALARTAAQRSDIVIAAGGDGTLNEVLNGLADHFQNVCLGLLPLGTGNDFARTIGMPETLDDAIDTILRGQTRRVDVIRVDIASRRHHMINVSAGGFSAKVNEKLTDDVKQRWGPLCYARSFVAAISEREDYQTEIVLDDGTERLDAPAYNVIVANGRYVANGVPIAPSARIDDGLADLIVLPVASLPQLALLAQATLAGKHLEHDQLVFRRARKIRITSKPPMSFNTDGELIGDDPITFEVLPQAIECIVGTPAQGAAAGT